MQSKNLVAARRDVQFIDAQIAEVQRARAKFPGNAVMTLALMEQVGKLAQALEHTRRGHGERCGAGYVQSLAVTVASMAMRVATEGDSSVPQYLGDSSEQGEVAE